MPLLDDIPLDTRLNTLRMPRKVCNFILFTPKKHIKFRFNSRSQLLQEKI